jgi:PBP1b-binding outer membrane lipoprotein LpoB
MRRFLTVIMGAMLLGGCAAKPTATSAQAVSAQENKDIAACLEQPLNKESYEEHQKSFAACMRAKGYQEEKLHPSDTTGNARSPLISDSLKNLARKSSPDLAVSEDYERAVADYNNCVLENTSNLSACEKQQAIMNGRGKVSSRLSSSQRYQITPTISQTTNTAGVTQGANTANITQATLSQDPARTSQTPPVTPSQTPAPIAPQTTSSLPEQIPPPPGDRPIPF